MTTYYADIQIIKAPPNSLTPKPILTKLTHTVACDSAGAVISFSDYVTKMLIYQGSNESSYLWEFSRVDSAGIVSTIVDNKVSLASMTVDSGTIAITASRAGYADQELTATFTKSYSPSSAGTPGTDGQRGNVQIIGDIAGSVWSNSSANSAVMAAGFGAPMNRDVVTLRNLTTHFVESRFYNSGSWLVLDEYIDGNLLVTGTVSADVLSAGTIETASGNAQVRIGNFSSIQGGNSSLYAVKTAPAPLHYLIAATNNQDEAGCIWGGSSNQPVGDGNGVVGTCTIANSLNHYQYLGALGSGLGYAGVYGVSFGVGRAGFFAYYNGTNSISAGAATNVLEVANVNYAVSNLTGQGAAKFPDGVGTFTGFHETIIESESVPEIGDILLDASIIQKTDISNVMFESEVSSAPYQKNVVGVLSLAKDIGNDFDVPYETWWEYATSHKLLRANALGEGQINVCGEGGDINVGDYIVTSSTPGKGMRMDMSQPVTFDLMACIVAKAREAVTFSGSEIKQIPCFYQCG